MEEMLFEYEYDENSLDNLTISDLSEGSSPIPPRVEWLVVDDSSSVQNSVRGDQITSDSVNMIFGFNKYFDCLPIGNKIYEDKMASFCAQRYQGDNCNEIKSNMNLAKLFLCDFFPTMTFWVLKNGRPSTKHWKERWFVRADKITIMKKVKAALKSRLGRAMTNKKESMTVESNKKRTIADMSNGTNNDAPSHTTTKLLSRLSEAQSDTQEWQIMRDFRTVDEFILMFDKVEGLINRCVDRIHLHIVNSNTKDLEDWARIWAMNLRTGDDTARNLDKDWKYCLEFLFTLCNRWKGVYDGTPTISDDDIANKFMTKRILPILRVCLVMDRAKALYFTTGLNFTTPGINWYAERHILNDLTLDDQNGIASMNERYFWLLEFDQLKLGPNETPPLHQFAKPMKVADIPGIPTTTGSDDGYNQIAKKRNVCRTVSFDGEEYNI